MKIRNERTKVVATIGPASWSADVLKGILRGGADVIRLNFSHGTHEEHGNVIRLVRRIAQEWDACFAVMQDLQGPKIRIGRLQGGGPITLKRGGEVAITSRSVVGDDSLLGISYRNFPDDVKVGDCVLLKDGCVELKVLSKTPQDVRCRVTVGGELNERAGVNLPGVAVSSPALTPKDRADLAYGLKMGVDYIAMSFVRSASDIVSLKSQIQRHNADVPVIAKIEKPEAVKHLREILDAADGVMVARGDLAVETSVADVPVFQKRIIEMANQRGKIAITATQMLESMVNAPSPTRAEASDVANAVYDGSDAVMLSAETSIGKYPVRAVRVMVDILKAAERDIFRKSEPRSGAGRAASFAEATVDAACDAARELSAKAIIVFTESGATAQLVAMRRPAAKIFAFAPDEAVRRRLALVWGVVPLPIKRARNSDELLAAAERYLVEHRLLRTGSVVVTVAGTTALSGATNVMKLSRVGDVSSGGP